MKSKPKAVVPNIITTSFILKSRSTQPKGKRAGQTVRWGATVALATVVSGVGAAYGAISGFAKGLWS